MAMNETLSAFPVKGEDDMWTPYKELQGVVDDCISDPGQKNSLKRLETALRKHKQNFITILKNPPKNAKCREELKHDGGTSFTGAPLAHDLVEEACVLSDMYDLNEFMALQLLVTAERQMPCHPGLPRGLVAVLLYYDGRVALAGALCTLVRARRGVTWDLHAETSSAFAMDDGLDSQKTQLIDYVTRYTDELAGSGLLEHLIDLVEGLDLSREIEILHGGRALGGPRHRREVTHLFLSLKQTISDTIFFWSAQTGLTQRPLMRLIAYMKKVKEESENGVLSNVNLSLTMAMLYAIDLGILHRKDDREVLAKKLPLLSDKGVGQELFRCICPSSEEEEGASLEESWTCPALLGLIQLATGLAVSTLRSAGTSSELILPDALMDEEDNLIDSAVRLCVFEFLYRTILGNSSIYKEEFYLRRLHGLLADFIILHPTKVRELRRAADEAARTIQAYTQEGLEPPSNLQYHFESFLRSIGRLHEQDPLSLQLALDYWPRSTLPDTRHGTAAHILSSAHLLGSADGRGALWRFVRQCGWGDSPHPLPPALFVPYLQMLRGLSSSPRAAAQCFAFLRPQSLQPSPVLIPESRGDSSAISGMGPVPSSPISWDHFFRSLHRYLCNLRVELPPTDTVYSQRSTGGAGVSLISRGITPLELEGLHSVLALLTTIAEQDESSRLALAENATWGAIPSLLGLVTCPVPIPLKARLIRALAALATPSSSASDRAAESSITTMVWHHLEASQILLTIPTTSCYQPRGVQTELEEVESRNEEYPLTRAMLHLLDALTGPVGPTKSSSSKVSTVPPLLGMGTRVPGLDPYLNYVINSVFLPFASRSYRNMEEKWLVCRLCLRLFLKFLRQYEPSSEDFTTRIVEVREANSTVTGSSVVTATTVAPPPGFHLMIQLHSKSELLRIILSIIDEVAGCLEEANPETTRSKKERRLMEGCALGCLRVLRRALMLQGRFTALLSASSEDPLLLTGLDRLLLAVNPRSGKHDHLLNVARYICQAGWLPKHAPAALGILALATACPRSPSSAAQVHLLSLLTSSPQATAQVRHAFVECMEAEEDEVVDFEEDKDIGPDEADEEDGAAHGESVLEPSEGSSPNSSEPFKGLSIRGRAKEMVLRLLLQWLPQSPAPNLAHFFLGFHLSKDLRKTVFQQPGILGFPRTCLHALLALLDHGLATNLQVTTPSHAQSSVLDVAALRPRAPHSALLDLGYRLLYALCADPRTSEPVLRFLRSSSSAGGVAGGHYLTRHLLSIPIISSPGEASACSPQKRCEVNALGQTSWLLRTVAVELKALAANRHHLQLTTLLRTLLSTPSVPGSQALGSTMRTVGPGWPGRAADTSELSVDGSRLGGEEEDKDEETTLQLSRSHLLPVGSLPPSGARPHDRLLIRVLEALNFSPEQTPSPNWEFFEPSQIQQVLRNCEVSIGPGGDSWPHVAPSCPALRLVNLDSLRRTLMDELQSIQVSQRQAIVAEMKEVLKYAKEYNHGRARAWGVARCTEGWCQVTEVLFATTPSEALAPSLHLQLLLDVLQVILKKSLATDVTPDLATMSSGVILLLLVNLRNLHLVAVREARLRCLPQKVGVGKTPMPGSQVDTPVTSHLSGRNAPSLGAEATLQANSAALKVILSGILQWIVSSAPPSQKLRINLYGALLNFLHVTCTEGDEWNVGIPSVINFSSGSLSESFRSTLGSPAYASGSRVKNQPTEEERSQRLACLEVMLGFGEGLVDVLCHDSTSGHDVCKMLALSCLETLVVLDASTGPASTLSLLCARGFLCHLVDSLLASDRTLQGVLEEDEGYAGGGDYSSGGVDLRPLYVYESKMAALCRIARSSRGGAEALLERKVMGCLSAMKVFDARPDGPFWSHADGTVSGEFVPPVAGRYLQIWLPALHLCDALLISLGSRNESCASQVAHFLVSHSEAVGAALRGAGAPRSASTSQGHLQEIACLTGVIALAARHPGIIGPGEGEVPADPLWRVRKLMFSLLPRFLLPEDSPGGKTVCVQGDEETALCVLKVAAHLLLYIRRLSVPDGAVGETGGAADPRECRIVFSPSLSGAELVPSGDPRGTRTTAARNIPVRAGGIGTAGPPLGLLVARLVSAVGLDATLAAAETQLYGQLASVPDMNSQELREFLPQGASMTAASMEAARAQAARCLGRRLQQTSRRRELLWFVADHCLLLLWVHLDHFLRRSFSPGDRGIPMSLNSTRDDSNWSVDVEEISRLKSGLVSVFNDGFCKRLIETRQEVKDRGFVEALVRRIKRLIQFVPVS